MTELSKASSRIGIPKFFKSVSQKKGTASQNPGKSKQETTDNPQAGIVDALEVVLRVEVNQKNPDGVTKPYRLVIPSLTVASFDAIGKT